MELTDRKMGGGGGQRISTYLKRKFKKPQKKQPVLLGQNGSSHGRQKKATVNSSERRAAVWETEVGKIQRNLVCS